MVGCWFVLLAVASGRHEHAKDIADWARSHHPEEPFDADEAKSSSSKTTTSSVELLPTPFKKAFASVGGDAALPTTREAALAKAKAALRELIEYYHGDERMLREATRGVSKATERLGARLARKVLSGEPLVICGVGSSVTAGHDGFGSTAWPAVLERRLRRGVIDSSRVTVNNQAVGGQKPYPVSFCLEAVCGQADAVFREWEYWTLDDGAEPYRRDLGGRAGPLAAAEHFAARVADLADDGDALAGFIQLDVSGKKEHKTKLLTEHLLSGANKNSFSSGDTPVAVFSAFGVAFDHLRATQGERMDRQGRSKCQGPNVGDCPLAPYPDGYHSRAEKEGVDEPPSHQPPKLFINWHPGSLGHEVVGNQLAYFLLTRLVDALEVQKAFKPPAPPPRQRVVEREEEDAQSPLVSSKVRCAVSTRPAVKGPSVGDLVANGTTATRWADEPTASAFRQQEACARGCRGSETHCFDHLRKCSYGDQKRGFKGGPQDGPLRLRIPFRSDDRCVAYLVEPGYEWSKPLLMANWYAELAITIDGTRCDQGACNVVQGRGEYLQAMRIDVKAHRGGAGTACSPALVEVQVDPVDGLLEWEKATSHQVCAVAKNGRCEPFGAWKRYDFRCVKPEPNNRGPDVVVNGGGPGPLGAACAPQATRRPKDQVRTYVSTVIYL
eukprot:CAMPEP_0118896664 /NCGR_PEP_ID=MMETSP1166-20130328/4417_1 /TAXON_ID=1104430 /ORGANISM="Chrysoreinhardia sp, Strain CCMP3193" /LENGTH=666 /DNA_ID=CAMNT_0006835723 /DNA_START=40 /DNA_END=2040 /DNA_ORIENTATION=+